MSQNPNYNPYGQNPPDPNTPPQTFYGSPQPSLGQGSSPNYGPYNPSTPYPPTPEPAVNPNYNPYDPYGPTVAGQGTSPDFNPYAPPPPPALPPTQPRSRGVSWRVVLLVVLALVLVIGGIAFGLVSYNTTQTNNANATATATTHEMATANAIAAVTKTASANQTATATANLNPYDPSGSWTLVYDDPLSQPSHWVDSGATNQGGCQYRGGKYHVLEPQSAYIFTCRANQGSPIMFSNVTIQVNMAITNGDCGGLEVRDQPTTNLSGYFVYLCTGGYYEFDVDVNGKDTTLTSGNNSVFNNGLNRTHTIALTAIGNTFKLFVDSTAKYTFQWTASTFSNGQIGLVAWDESTSTDAVFDHAKVWSSQ